MTQSSAPQSLIPKIILPKISSKIFSKPLPPPAPPKTTTKTLAEERTVFKKPANSSQNSLNGLRQAKKFNAPSYLYQRGNFYYFRYRLPEQLSRSYGVAELRLSLRTPFRRVARYRATIIYSNLIELLKDTQMLKIKDIRERMTGLLRQMLDIEDVNVSHRAGVVGGSINFTHREYSACAANILQCWENNPELLIKHSDECVAMLVDAGVFDPSEITEKNLLPIVQQHNRMQISLHKIISARERGDYSLEQTFLAAPYQAVGAWKAQETTTLPEPHNIALSIKEQTQDSKLISELIHMYTSTRVTDGAWKKHSVTNHSHRLQNLLEIIGDVPINTIDRATMRKFRDTLMKLPPNRTKSKIYKNKTIQELLELNLKDVLNITTVNLTIEEVSTFFEWCTREGFLAQNSAKALQIKDNRQDIELRDAFSLSDVTKLFSSPKYTDDAFKHASFFWAPLIALYTGMRLEEICQLHCADIYESDTTGLWVFDVNAKPSKNGTVDKLLKSKNAQRIIPMHNDLIKIGLIEYRNRISQHGEERLFPELNKTEASPKYGKQPGKSFSRLVSQLGLEGKKSFHSLRHSFSDFFKTRGLHNDAFRQVFGHEIKELAGRQYGSKFSAAKCYDDLICKLEFEINCEALCKSMFAKGK